MSRWLISLTRVLSWSLNTIFEIGRMPGRVELTLLPKLGKLRMPAALLRHVLSMELFVSSNSRTWTSTCTAQFSSLPVGGHTSRPDNVRTRVASNASIVQPVPHTDVSFASLLSCSRGTQIVGSPKPLRDYAHLLALAVMLPIRGQVSYYYSRSGPALSLDLQSFGPEALALFSR